MKRANSNRSAQKSGLTKAYIAGTDCGITSRTWQQAIESLTNTKQGANKER